MDDRRLIDAQGLGKTYGNLAVLIDANFAVNKGEIRALVGSKIVRSVTRTRLVSRSRTQI